jgi:hypothetical protein
MSKRDAAGNDVRRWWAVAATGTAGTAALAALAALVAVPASGSTPPPDAGGSSVAHDVHRPSGQDPAWCPSLPPVDFVGVPWAARVPRCPRLQRWWLFVGAGSQAAGVVSQWYSVR